MSAFVVSRTHIDVLIRGLIDREAIDITRADETGRMLWQENIDSVAYRYPNDGPTERPGYRSGFHDDHVSEYTYTDPMYGPSNSELYGALGTYAYQSCEHDTWEASDAYELVTSVRESLGVTVGTGPHEWEAVDVAAARVAGKGVARY